MADSIADRKRTEYIGFVKKCETLICIYRRIILAKLASSRATKTSQIFILPPPQVYLPDEHDFPDMRHVMKQVTSQLRNVDKLEVLWTPAAPFIIKCGWPVSVNIHGTVLQRDVGADQTAKPFVFTHAQAPMSTAFSTALPVQEPRITADRPSTPRVPAPAPRDPTVDDLDKLLSKFT